MQQSIKIFCSCASESPRDKYLINRLMTHLDNLERQIQVKVWYPQKIAPGVDSRQEINENLKSADIILLCVSPDYMFSDGCCREAKQAARLEQLGKAMVRVILLRHVYWKDAVFGRCEVLPKSRKFISKYSDKDEAFDEITQNIRDLLQDVYLNRAIQKANHTYFDGSSDEIQTSIRTITPPTMPTVEELRRNRQTEEIIVNRQTEEPKIDRQTEELRRRRPRANKKDNEPVFDAEATSLKVAATLKKKPMPGIKRRKRNVQGSRAQKSAGAEKWFRQARLEVRYVTKGKRGIFWGSILVCDVLGIPGIIWYLSNSWGLFGLAFCISLPIFVAGTINMDGLMAIVPSLLYTGFWWLIIHYYIPQYPLVIVGIACFIALIHFLLFRKHYR